MTIEMVWVDKELVEKIVEVVEGISEVPKEIVEV